MIDNELLNLLNQIKTTIERGDIKGYKDLLYLINQTNHMNNPEVSGILNDFIEPYLLKVFENMDEYRKSAYKSYLLWDIASMAGLLFFVLNFSETGDMMVYAGLFVYFIGTKQKRPYQSTFLGNVTKDDVEAAKAAAEQEKDEE